MRIVKWTLEGRAPAFDVFHQALDALVLRPDLGADAILHFFRSRDTTFQVRAVIISDEFQRLGITDQVNQAVVEELGIHTLEQLVKVSETRLLQVTGFSYVSLLLVNRALVVMGLQLQGEHVPVADRLENLPFSKKQIDPYEFLKKAGIHRISQVTSLDIVGLQIILGRHLAELLRVLELAEQDLHPGPLGPDRMVSDLLRLQGLVPAATVDMLTRAGFGAATLVHDIHAQNLRAGIERVRRGPNIDFWVERIRSSLAAVGYALPDGPA